MKEILLIFITVAITACTGPVKTEQHNHENGKEHFEAAASLKNGSKWKADEATKRNVSAMIQVVSDSIYANAANRKQLHVTLQTKIDTLVKQCRMKGAEHDALHAWLEKVLKDMKELKEEDQEYNKVYAVLKNDIEDFNSSFE